MTKPPGFRVVGSETISDVGFLRVDLRTIEAPSGERVERVAIAHPGAVAVVPLVGEDVILIEQYRAPVDKLVLEIPAGKLDETDIDAIEAAKRELMEEVGYAASSWSVLSSILTTVGFTDERITIFLATGITEGTPAPDGAEEASSTLHRLPLVDAVDMVVRGDIEDAKTIVGILLASRVIGTMDPEDPLVS